MLKNFLNWSGNIDELRSTAHQIVEENEIEYVAEVYSVRLVRDYVRRGMLGVDSEALLGVDEDSKKEKELLFEYEDLLKFIVIRMRLKDGEELESIQELFWLTSLSEIEDMLSGKLPEWLT